MGRGMSCVQKEGKRKNSNIVSVESDENMYHEKQSRELCALHALNNLLQDAKAFSKSNLDEICRNLSPETYINPHRSFLGLGNYDVNVIMAALQTKQYDTIWFDKRKDINLLHLENIFGFILNIPTDLEWGYIKLPIHRKHWISLREINGKYYNLDSKLDSPELIGNQRELKANLREQILSKDKELLLIVEPYVAHNGLWYKDAFNPNGALQNGTSGSAKKRDQKNQSSSTVNSGNASNKNNPETKV